MPTRKITAVAAGGALATLATFIGGLFGLELPEAVATAVGSLAAFGFGYLTGEHDEPGDHAA